MKYISLDDRNYVRHSCSIIGEFHVKEHLLKSDKTIERVEFDVMRVIVKFHFSSRRTTLRL